jgi:hypothetical protein
MGLMVSNRGELARGWYERVLKLQREGPPPQLPSPPNLDTRQAKRQRKDRIDNDSSDGIDEFSPVLPGQERESRKPLGPSAPKFEDLELQKGRFIITFPFLPPFVYMTDSSYRTSYRRPQKRDSGFTS